jgi:hypothetical protein
MRRAAEFRLPLPIDSWAQGGQDKESEVGIECIGTARADIANAPGKRFHLTSDELPPLVHLHA